MSTSNIIPVSSLGGGGPTFVVTAENLGTPVITGTVDSVVITNVSGSAYGSVNDFVQIVATNPVDTAIVVIPIEYPVTPMPDRFGMNIQLFTGAPPPVAYTAFISFMNEDETKSWSMVHSIPTESETAPAWKVIETVGGVVGGNWDYPDTSRNNSVDVFAQIEKVAPFEELPQIVFDCDVGGFDLSVPRVHGIAYSFAKTSGTFNSGWEGEDFHHPVITILYPTHVGDLTLFCYVEFTPHIKDR